MEDAPYTFLARARTCPAWFTRADSWEAHADFGGYG
jgi:hypothetical protein